MSKKSMIVFLAVAGLSGTASAATRTVCLELSFLDNRDHANCATIFEPGNFRGCMNGDFLPHVGAVIELWDKDPDGSDELIGRFLKQSTGQSCWAFEWDSNSSANGEHEANPDVYAVWVNEVRNTGNNRSVFARQANGSAHAPVSWRNGISGEPDRYVAQECTTAGACRILPGKALVPSADINTDVAKRSLVLDSAQHTLQQFGGIMTHDVNIEVPDAECAPTPACSHSRTKITMSDGAVTDGTTVAHEIGHNIQKQVFNRDSLRNDTSNNGFGWNLTFPEFDSAATTEGFATYVALASWYDGGVANVNPNLWSMRFEDAAPFATSSCGANRGLALQSAKAFWDLDDITNEAGAGRASSFADNDAFFPFAIAMAWGTFPAGTANRQNFEEDNHGVNVRDYHANTVAPFFGSSPTMFTTMLRHNCVVDQDDN